VIGHVDPLIEAGEAEIVLEGDGVVRCTPR
jgi:hypothetical protein